MDIEGVPKKDRRQQRRITVVCDDLPTSVPKDSVCNVYPVSALDSLSSGDLIMILERGRYRPRRYLRSSGEWAWVCGDTLKDLEIRSCSGDLFKVTSIYKNNEPLAIKKVNSLTIGLNWIRSFLQ